MLYYPDRESEGKRGAMGLQMKTIWICMWLFTTPSQILKRGFAWQLYPIPHWRSFPTKPLERPGSSVLQLKGTPFSQICDMSVNLNIRLLLIGQLKSTSVNHKSQRNYYFWNHDFNLAVILIGEQLLVECWDHSQTFTKIMALLSSLPPRSWCQNIFFCHIWGGSYRVLTTACSFRKQLFPIWGTGWDVNFWARIFEMLLMSNVYLKDIPLAGHLHRVTMQKVPQILSQKTGKISKGHVFPIKKRQNQHTLKRKIPICHLEVVLT